MTTDPRLRAVASLRGLWTDDAEMACSVFSVLDSHGTVDQDVLAARFAEHHDFDRGYGAGVDRMLRLIRQEGGDWRELAREAFDGRGSWGNGAAMRGAPLGAWFAGDPARAPAGARRSAEVTHMPQTPCRSACGSSPNGCPASRRRCGTPPSSAATWTPPARSSAAASRPASAWTESRPSGWSAANRSRRGQGDLR